MYCHAVAVCESCAGEVDDDELTPVWPADGATGADTQLWCLDCRTQFGHEPAEDDDTA
jgi:hypothetical protein